MPSRRSLHRSRPARLAVAVAALCAPLVAVMAIILTGPSVLAVAPIMAQGGGCSGSIGWTNANQTVSVGDSVTWSNCATGFHQLQSTSSGWCLANNQTAGQTGTPWSYTCKFAASGSYTYWCSVHTTQMAGTITVTAAAPPPTPSASPSSASPSRSTPPLPPSGIHTSPSPAAAARSFPAGPLVLGLLVLLGGGAAAVYFLRIRRPDTPGS